MSVLVSIVTTSDIIKDASASEAAKRDVDVKEALKTDRKARKAHRAAVKGLRVLERLQSEEKIK